MADYTLIIVAVMVLIVLYVLWLKVLAPIFAGVQKITIAEYRDQFKKQSHVLLDVRSESEFAAAHIPRAKRISVEDVARSSRETLTELIHDKPVICICATGNRSSMAATVIARYGFSPIYVLSGGMGAWTSAGLTVRRSKG
ncbi:MAG: rhodanese-like domain-containing protein [Mariprofundaceae bacterium]